MRFDTHDLARFQHDVLKVLTGPNTPLEPALKIHHDTWLLGLIDALRDSCPVTASILGDESFRAFARDHVRAHPLTRGDRNGYGEGFADLLQTHLHLPAPWLPDLVRYEQALHHAQGARDAEPCLFQDLLSPQARVALHPSVRLLSLCHDVTDVSADDIPSVPVVTCDLLVGRSHDDDVIRVALTPYELDFLTLIEREASLIVTLERLSPDDDEMAQLQSLLARLVQHGLLIIL